MCVWEGVWEGGSEGVWEGGREGGREEGREGGRERGRGEGGEVGARVQRLGRARGECMSLLYGSSSRSCSSPASYVWFARLI